MKFHRVKGEFPVGVVPCVHMSVVGSTSSAWDWFNEMFDGRPPPTIASRVEKLISNAPISISIEVPEKAAAATALALRAMADELEGKL